MEPDVEALLVSRISRSSATGGGHDAVDGQRGPHYFLVPIDACYKLVGLIRANWRGLSGGQDVWKEIERFFTEMRATATVARRQ
jgi:hypothetical protein